MALEEKKFSLDEPSIHATAADQGLLSKSIDDLQLSVRSRKCVQKLNVHNINELTRKTDAELLGCKNFGVTSLNEIKRTLANLGLSLRSLD
jgi:DNA-directed RNA polymerase subunit alpha